MLIFRSCETRAEGLNHPDPSLNVLTPSLAQPLVNQSPSKIKSAQGSALHTLLLGPSWDLIVTIRPASRGIEAFKCLVNVATIA